MKFLVVLADGMADYPLAELDNQTPLQYANTPNIDYLSKRSLLGKVETIPANFAPGSDVANLSVLGYDPEKYYTGRSPLEAISMNVSLSSKDLALRCNFVTISGSNDYEKMTMLDYSAGEISNEEASILINDLQAQLGSESFSFHSGISYRNLVIWSDGVDKDLELTPPHDISDRLIQSYLPRGKDSPPIYELMRASFNILNDHPVNIERVRQGHNPANSIWFWGEGRKPQLPSFFELYGLKGSVVAAVDLVRGLGISAGLTPVKVSGATGSIETNFSGKCDAALSELLNGQDFVYLHIESPDEAGHQGNLAKKIWSIEQIDKYVIGKCIEQLSLFDNIRILLLPDHPTPVSLKTHTSDPVPFMMFDSSDKTNNPDAKYDEFNSNQGIYISPGHKLMELFINSVSN